MPMPKPRKDESHDAFIDRCMGDEAMNEDFPDAAQRRGVCESQWDDRPDDEDAVAAGGLTDMESLTGAADPSLAGPVLVGEQGPELFIPLPHVRAAIGSPWAILPEHLVTIRNIVARHAGLTVIEGGDLTADERGALAHDAAKHRHRRAGTGAIAVLNLFGVIAQRMNMIMQSSGGTSTELFGAAFRQAVDDPKIGAIILNVDSPGGNVAGVGELAREIFNARGDKPIIAVANSMAASAAYWIASAADELVVTPSGQVGSIGVIALHENVSGMLEQAGVETTLISAGKFKTEGHPFGPLDDEATAAVQESVDDYYDQFVDAIARHRGVRAARVRGGFAQGRMTSAARAVDFGMADRVATFDETLARFGAGAPARGFASGGVVKPAEHPVLMGTRLCGLGLTAKRKRELDLRERT